MAWSKESRHARGYGNDWDKLRLAILIRDNYLCQCKTCKSTNRVRPASEVDHITSKATGKALGWNKAKIDHPDNLQAINHECHDIKTIEETGKTYTPKQRIGLDGFPITVKERTQ